MFEHQLIDTAVVRPSPHRAARGRGGADPARGRHPAAPQRRRPHPARRPDADPAARGDARRRHLGGRGAQPVRRGAARAVRAGVRRTPRSQGHRPRGGPRHRRRRVLLRHHDGRARPRRRHGLGRGQHHRAHDPPGPGVRAHRARRLGRVVGVLHVPAQPGAGLRRLRGQPRPHRPAARRHRHRLGPHGGRLRRRAAGRDAVLLHRLLRLRHRRAEGDRGDRAGARAGAGAAGGGADPVRRRDRRRRRPHQAARLGGRRPGDRVRLPRPQHGQQHLQGRPALGRRPRGRPDPAGTAQAGERPVARGDWCATSSTPWRSPPSRPSSRRRRR